MKASNAPDLEEQIIIRKPFAESTWGELENLLVAALHSIPTRSKACPHHERHSAMLPATCLQGKPGIFRENSVSMIDSLEHSHTMAWKVSSKKMHATLQSTPAPMQVIPQSRN